MLSKKSSGAPKAARSAMPPPPSPVIRDSAAMAVDSFSELQSFLSQQYPSPEMTTADSAAHAFAYSSAGFTGNVGSGAGTAEADLESFLAWISPSTAQQNLQPSTPLSASTSFTSPAPYFSPFPDVLNTPVVDPLATFGRSPDIVNASPAQPLNLFDDLDNAGLSLFSDFMTVASNATASTSSTVKPTALDLQLTAPLSRHQSWEQGVSESSASNSSVSPKSFSNPLASPHGGSTGSSTRAPQQPNGVRKNVKVADLIPIDAPIQPRNYITPSATSRKDIPPSVARTFVPNSRKRTASSAGLMSPEDMQDELADEDPAAAEEARRRREMDPEKAALLEHVEQARRRNTLAARKSRQRKLEHVRGLEELVERLQQENEELKTGKDEVLRENEELKKKLKAYQEKIESLGGVVPTD